MMILKGRRLVDSLFSLSRLYDPHGHIDDCWQIAPVRIDDDVVAVITCTMSCSLDPLNLPFDHRSRLLPQASPPERLVAPSARQGSVIQTV